MTINDDKLMLLEQLTYLNSSVAAAAGIKANYKRIENEKGKTIHDFLNQFTEESLAELEQQGTIFDEYGNSTHAQGKEWAAIIRALKSEESIKDLVISDVASHANGKTATICFTDKDQPDQAVVAFRGTLDGDEWEDDVEGLNETDTECQREALDYIESLPYNDITVVGHSKGGNKAQYVTVLSDKVTRCVSMDGQGFSNEFLEKYWAEIQKKGSAIKNYSLNNDFVHILLFPVPGSEQLYFEGYGMETGLENHSPNSFFYVIDQDGHAVLKYDENGIYLKQTHAEYNSIAYLHEFVNFVLNVMPDADKEKVVGYISVLLGIAMGGKEIEIDGVVYSKKNIYDYLATDYETLSLVAAYLIEYIDVYELTEDQVYDLLSAFGLDQLVMELNADLGKSLIVPGGLDLISFLILEIKDGKKDGIISGFLLAISIVLKKKHGVDIDLVKVWNGAEKKIQKINHIDKSTANKNRNVKTGKKMNFSKEMYEYLISKINSFEASVMGDVSSWSGYSGEEWYSALGISLARTGINLYVNKLSDINSTCKNNIEIVYNNEWSIDNSAAEKISALIETLNDGINNYSIIAERLA